MRFASAAINLFLWTAARGAGTSQAFGGRSSCSSSSSVSLHHRYTVCRSSSVIRRTLPSPSFLTTKMTNGSTVCRGGSSGSSSSSSTRCTALNAAVAAAAESSEAATVSKPVEIFRKDYQPLPLTVSKVQLKFEIFDGRTQVTTTMTLQSNPQYTAPEDQEQQPTTTTTTDHHLVLDGDETAVKLLQLQVDGKDLTVDVDYELRPRQLILKNVQSGSIVQTVCEIVPELNTQLSGLYQSDGMYCTQCEAMGFRRITYYPDRPDNMAVFDSVRIEADATYYPLLLSNGNLIEQGQCDNNRHYAIWSDPYPKPSYLFAVVAGALGGIEESYTTISGRQVQLRLFSEFNNVEKLHYAMDALKRSMKWDEDRYGVRFLIALSIHI